MPHSLLKNSNAPIVQQFMRAASPNSGVESAAATGAIMTTMGSLLAPVESIGIGRRRCRKQVPTTASSRTAAALSKKELAWRAVPTVVAASDMLWRRPTIDS